MAILSMLEIPKKAIKLRVHKMMNQKSLKPLLQPAKLVIDGLEANYTSDDDDDNE